MVAMEAALDWDRLHGSQFISEDTLDKVDYWLELAEWAEEKMLDERRTRTSGAKVSTNK